VTGTSAKPPNGRPALPAAWEPNRVEPRLYARWLDRAYFTPEADSGRPPFSIAIPPPNVTGNLHVGHALEHSMMDALTRRARMRGEATLWLPGMDHASIAVHALVERQLAEEGSSRRALGRERFIDRVWEWKERYGGQILSQMERLGDGVDFTRERFTMDERLSRAVRTIFKRLYDDGLIYRAERLVNWSPVLESVLSDAEVEHREVSGELISMRYGAVGGAEGPSLVVATTRVETMLGDTAVAVHPDDERYTALVGTEVELPLAGRRIPVIADEHVDPGFGTGAVKVTPAHDPNDFDIGRRHDLPMLTIMDEQGRIAHTGTEFDGMDRFAARAAIRERLRGQGRIVSERRPYVHIVGHSERSKEPIEPRLSLQWFVKVGPLARAAGDAVRDGRVAVHPPESARRYFDWVDNLHDWCISRQLWWGHRIPVWYSPDGAEMVCPSPGESPPEVWSQDEDVLDTWFSSGLWPFSTLGWPDDTADLRTFYPTTVLVTGYDILFFWVIRMMMFGLYAMDGAPPFRTIALHGMVRDGAGRKMSKSNRNTVDPLEWIEDYGADAVRFTLLRGANPGTDVPVDEEWVAASRNFGTKLWNAARFALLNGASAEATVDPALLTDADRWILDRTGEVAAEVDELFDDFQFAKLAAALYHFTWGEFCDWYVELAKVQMGSGDDGLASNTRAVLGNVLDVLLRLLHPLIPFITEELWTALTGGESLVVASWPTALGKPADEGARERIEDLQRLVVEVRRFRADQGLKPGQRVAARIAGLDAAGLLPLEPALRALARLSPPGDSFAPSTSLQVALSGTTVAVALDLSGAVDFAAERGRLEKDLAAARKELEQAEKKLGNPGFTGKAPADVVENTRSRRRAALTDIERITTRLDTLAAA
jgi:valyl-tRNA synthetase